MKLIKRILNRYYFKRVSLSFEANFNQKKKKFKLSSCIPLYRPNDVYSAIVGAIYAVGTFLATDIGVTLGVGALGLTWGGLALVGATAGYSLWSSNRSKSKRGGGMEGNGHLVNSRLSSEPVKIIYGVLKMGGNWIFPGGQDVLLSRFYF